MRRNAGRQSTARMPLLAFTLVQEIRNEVNGNEALDFVVGLHETDRWATFAKFQETAGRLRKTMNAGHLAADAELGVQGDVWPELGLGRPDAQVCIGIAIWQRRASRPLPSRNWSG